MICMVNVGKYTIHDEVSFSFKHLPIFFLCAKKLASVHLLRAGGETDPANHAEFR